MSNRVSFSPVKKVLTYSPMDSVAELRNNKKLAVLTSLSTNMPKGTPDIIPFGGDVTEGTETFMKLVAELEDRFKKKASKPRKKIGKKSARKTKSKNPKRKWYKNKFQIEKFIKVKKEPKQRKEKTQEGLFLSKKTTLNSLISKLNFAKVPLTQLLSQ